MDGAHLFGLLVGSLDSSLLISCGECEENGGSVGRFPDINFRFRSSTLSIAQGWRGWHGWLDTCEWDMISRGQSAMHDDNIETLDPGAENESD